MVLISTTGSTIPRGPTTTYFHSKYKGVFKIHFNKMPGFILL